MAYLSIFLPLRKGRLFILSLIAREELACLLGTSKQVISRYETDQTIPKVTIANEYALKLYVPLAFLLGEFGQEEKPTTKFADELSEKNVL